MKNPPDEKAFDLTTENNGDQYVKYPQMYSTVNANVTQYKSKPKERDTVTDKRKGLVYDTVSVSQL